MIGAQVLKGTDYCFLSRFLRKKISFKLEMKKKFGSASSGGLRDGQNVRAFEPVELVLHDKGAD